MEDLKSNLTQFRDPQSKGEQAVANDSTCQKCHDIGFVSLANGVKSKCIECLEREIARKVALSIPARFRDQTFETYQPRNKLQVEALKRMSDEGPGEIGSYFLVGPYGCGKTHLLYSQYRNLSIGEPNFDLIYFFRTTHELLAELQSDQLEAANSRILLSLQLTRFRDPSEVHLFWDDADKFKVTDFKLEMLFHLVDLIYRTNAKLSVTSNLDLLELQEKLSPAICRRIDDICEKVKL